MRIAPLAVNHRSVAASYTNNSQIKAGRWEMARLTEAASGPYYV